MNILLLASHAVAEYDDLRMFTDLGYDVFAPGGYEVPSRSGEGIRPALPNAPHHPEFVEMCNQVRAERGEPGPMIDWAKAAIPDPIIEWADVIIAHHFVDRWIGDQWDRIRHKRVIWRTCGQSNPDLERYMTPFVDQGLEIVRYSPAERRHFGELGSFAGESAVIRFGKYPSDYGPWTGEWPGVINVTQNLYQRGEACGYPFWRDVTRGLDAMPIGQGSEAIGGTGAVPYPDMLAWLARARVYLYTGTTPASYTLGLMEAMLSGIPVVSISPNEWGRGWGGAMLFEGHEFASVWADSVDSTRVAINDLLRNDERAANASRDTREMGEFYFGIERIGQRWKDYLEGRPLDPDVPVSHFKSQRAKGLRGLEWAR